jgi:hypothetical protein
MPSNPPKKRAPVKSTAKKTTPKRTAAKKTASRKTVSRKTSAKQPGKAGGREADTLQSVARTIGATLGSWAKSTSDAVSAAKQALPNLKKIK